MVVVPPPNLIVPVPLNEFTAPSVTFCVPPPKLRIAGDVALKFPVLVPPPKKLSTPLRACTVPVLLSTTVLQLETPPPALFLSNPALLKVPVPAPSRNVLPAVWRSKVPAEGLEMTAPRLMVSDAMELNVVLAPRLRARLASCMLLTPLMASGAAGANVVAPLPLIPPPDQEPEPFTVKVPLPPSVPLERFRIPVAPLMLMVAVPPLMSVVPATL